MSPTPLLLLRSRSRLAPALPKRAARTRTVSTMQISGQRGLVSLGSSSVHLGIYSSHATVVGWEAPHFLVGTPCGHTQAPGHMPRLARRLVSVYILSVATSRQPSRCERCISHYSCKHDNRRRHKSLKRKSLPERTISEIRRRLTGRVNGIKLR